MKKPISILIVSLFLLALYPLSRYNYLLFHTLVEVWAMVVACAIFLVAWSTKDLIHDDYLLFLGTGYLNVAILTFFHTITYYGINIFPELGPDTATQFWMVSRFLETFILVLTPFLIGHRLKKRLLYTLFGGMSLFMILGITSILIIPFFPTCFEEGVGLTPFKIYSEYLIVLILSISLFFMYQLKEGEKDWFIKDYILAIILTILAELSFTLYTDVYGFFNFLGHIFYLISFYVIYRIIFVRGLKKPTTLLFNKLHEAEQNVRAINRCLLSFHEDNRKNIKGLVQSVGNLFGGAASFNELIGDELKVRAHWGMSNPLLSYPKEGSLCQEVIKGDLHNPLMKSYLQHSNKGGTDLRQKKNNYISFLGSPITTNDKVLGTLTIFFQKHRQFSPDSLKTFSIFAQILGDELNLLHLNRTRKMALERAKNLHMSLFPVAFPSMDPLIPASSYWQAEEISGDYFNLHYSGESLFFFMVDVTGHGLDAALITIYVSTFFRREIVNRQKQISPESFLRKLHYDFLQQGFPDDYSLEVFCGLLDMVTMEFNYAAAGSIRAIKITKNKGIYPLPHSNGSIINNYFQQPLLGIGKDFLEKGEALIIHTDGLDEPFLIKDLNNGQRRMNQFSQRLFHLLPFQDMLDRIIGDTLRDLTQGMMKDDMAIMGFYHPQKRQVRSWEVPRNFKDIIPFIDTLMEEISGVLRDPFPLRMALTEAINNALEHSKKQVLVEASWTKEYFTFTVTDDGPGYDWKRELENREPLLNLQEERGRGLQFIAIASHEFAINLKGNCIAMGWFLKDL